jgi:hypothetical protein
MCLCLCYIINMNANDKKDDLLCQYGYHKHITFIGGDGHFDTWRCDKCGKDAICTGMLVDHGVKTASKKLLDIAKTGKQHGKFTEDLQECADAILALHEEIKKLKDIT